MEVISQSQLFIDASATEDGSGGAALWLQRVQNVKVTDESAVEVVKALGVTGGAGFRRKTGGGTLMITEYRTNAPQVNWRQYRDEGKLFMLILQDENDGLREKWVTCRVSKVDRSADEEGNHTDEVEVKFLRSFSR